MARLQALSLFYRSLGQLLESGVPITRALESASGSGLAAARGLVGRIEAGDTLGEAFATRPDLFSAEQVKLIAVAERSGRLDVTFRELADYLDELISLRRTILSGLLLPALILHAAAFIVPLPTLVIGNGPGAYLVASLGFLAAVWVITGLLLGIVRSLSPATLDKLVRPLPLLGRTWRELDYWRVAGNLEMLITAGLGVIPGLRICAELCRSPRIARALHQAADRSETDGTPVSVGLRDSRAFPTDFIQLWATGEESGKLDEMLQRLARHFAERCRQRIRELAKWLPRLIYGAVMLYVALQILRLGASYVNLLNSIE